MQQFYDFDAVLEDVSAAVSDVMRRHGLEVYGPLAVCAVLEAISSPLKFQKLKGSPLMKKVGLKGMEAYLASFTARRVEVLKSPASLIVNAMMDAIALALLKKGSVPKDRLFREAVKVHLDLSGHPKNEIDEAFEKHASLLSATVSAVGYLQEGHVVQSSDNGTHWELII